MKLSIIALSILPLLALPSGATERYEEPLINSTEFQFQQPFVAVKKNREDKTASKAFNHKSVVLSEQPSVKKARDAIEQPQSTDFWVFDAWSSLENDFDHDGYYSKLIVEFDADTVYQRAYVYAILYLGTDDVYESYHVTSIFAINGDDSNDSFVVESELISGYPSNDYDILIELYDADTDQVVAITDGYDDADLAYVPLESNNYEVIPEPTVIIVEEHGGSVFWLSLLTAGIILYRRRH